MNLVSKPLFSWFECLLENDYVLTFEYVTKILRSMSE